MTRNSPDNTSAFQLVYPQPVALASAIAGDRQAVEGALHWIAPFVVRYCRAHLRGRESRWISIDDLV
jgi:hypothetical protein